MATTLLDPYTAAGLGGVEPHELEAELRAAASATWDCYDDPSDRGPHAEVCLAPATLLELLEIKRVSKTRPRATFARVELALAQSARALAAYMEVALLCIPGHKGGKEWQLRVRGERNGTEAGRPQHHGEACRP